VRRAEQDLEQVADVSPLDKGMTQREIRHHLVVIPPSLSLPQDITPVDQFREDPMGGAFGDSNGGGDVAQTDPWVVSHAHEDVGVVGQEVPAGRLRCQPRL
jgi:hypothetical protein